MPQFSKCDKFKKNQFWYYARIFKMCSKIAKFKKIPKYWGLTKCAQQFGNFPKNFKKFWAYAPNFQCAREF
jgi:hypothetical protein